MNCARAAALFAVALAIGSPAAGQDVPIWLGTVSKDSSLVTKPVRSWKAMKFDGLVRQQTDFSCGAAALATLFKYGMGKDTTEQHVLVNMLKTADADLVKEKGFSLLDMKRYVTAVGLKGEGFEVPYSALQQLKVPAIVLLNIKNYKHFVVIRKAQEDTVQVADPALGKRVISRAAFNKAWNGIVFVVLGADYDPRTTLLNPPPPLSARRLFEQRSPVPSADPADFGVDRVTRF
jgi:uncharacterized protein